MADAFLRFLGGEPPTERPAEPSRGLLDTHPGPAAPPGDRAIEALREAPRTQSTWTSDLSVDETVALSESGWEPCGLVCGAAVHHIGVAWPSRLLSHEIEPLTAAMRDARRAAMRDLVGEVERRQGLGVIGVEVDVRMHGREAEFIVLGTAIRPARPGRGAQSAAFTSDVSAQEFVLLLRAGYAPTHLAMGVCVFHAAHRGLTAMLGSAGRNGEIPALTDALYTARELAMTRLQREAVEHGAGGIVGVRIEERSHVWGRNAIEFLALGTGVRRVSTEPTAEGPVLAVPLDTRGRIAVEGSEEPRLATEEQIGEEAE
ncbi:MAG TPA: heavy metal-binding domain-containing protein [Candidatus Dormibacteraeota bacterium]|nr:heavy metal-binding domain-containing protein [Candidatus Dormibacteraeota bacterium]